MTELAKKPAPKPVEAAHDTVAKAAVNDAARQEAALKAAGMPVTDPKASDSGNESTADLTKTKSPEPQGGAWAAVKEAEQRMRQRESDMESREKQMVANIQAIEDKARAQNEFFDKLKMPGGAAEALAEHGVQFTDIVNDVLANPEGADPIDRRFTALDKEMEALRGTLKSTTEKLQDYEAKDQDADIKAYLEQTLANDKFALLRTHPTAIEEMKRLMVLYKEYQNKDLTGEEAAVMLQDEWKGQLAKLKAHAAVRVELGMPELPKGDTEDPAEGKAQTAPETKTSPSTISGYETTTPASGGIPSLAQDDRVKAAVGQIPPGFWSAMR